MDSKRLALYALVGVSLLWTAVEPVAAANYQSTTEALIRELNAKLLYVAIPIAVLVEGILFYAVWKYRDNDDPKPTEENRRLEITWTVATAIILLFVGYASYGVVAQITVPPDQTAPPEDAVVVDVIAQRWFWTFEYPDANVTTSEEMVIPANRTIYLNVTSRDWIHSYHVPEMGLKQDAIPGRRNTLRFEPTEPGQYQLFCAEYCGSGHSQMLGTVTVVNQADYQQWLDEQQEGGNQTASVSTRDRGVSR